MAECKDCIHFCVCSPYTAPSERYPEVGGCPAFQSLADFERMLQDGKDINVPTKWISVMDRLPEGNERVLACYINPLRKDRPPRMMVGEGTSTQLVKGKVYLWCGGWRSITHWMPLPKPPKGE